MGTAVYIGENQSAAFVECHFSDNGGDEGAIFVRNGCVLTVITCTFESNAACCRGGAISARFDAMVTVDGCEFRGNVGYTGGAISSEGQLLVRASLFTGKPSVASSDLNSSGGAVHNRGSCVLVNGKFLGNEAWLHGGAVLNASGATLTAINCLFAGNKTPIGVSAHIDGGAIFNNGISLTLSDCTLVGNQANSDGGGVTSNAGTLTIQNCVLWGNRGIAFASLQEQQVSVHAGMASIDHSCIEGWTGSLRGEGNHGNDPRFVDADGPDNVYGTADDDPRLRPNSLCMTPAMPCCCHSIHLTLMAMATYPSLCLSTLMHCPACGSQCGRGRV